MDGGINLLLMTLSENGEALQKNRTKRKMKKNVKGD